MMMNIDMNDKLIDDSLIFDWLVDLKGGADLERGTVTSGGRGYYLQVCKRLIKLGNQRAVLEIWFLEIKCRVRRSRSLGAFLESLSHGDSSRLLNCLFNIHVVQELLPYCRAADLSLNYIKFTITSKLYS